MGALNYCYNILQCMKTECIKQTQAPEQSIQRLSSVPPELQPDITPLFNARVLNVNLGNVFSIYPTLVVEMAFRLPYQVNSDFILMKLCDIYSNYGSVILQTFSSSL